MVSKISTPRRGAKAFRCPHCGAFAQQTWYKLAYGSFGRVTRFDALPKQFSLSSCAGCNQSALWHDDSLIYPAASNAPLPSEDMPSDSRLAFMEARDVVNRSPKAAAALLRLAMHSLIAPPTANGHASTGDMARLVYKGLPVQIQHALESVRVIGPRALPPGQIAEDDERETAGALFDLVNMIVEKTITEPNRIQEVYARLPETRGDPTRVG